MQYLDAEFGCGLDADVVLDAEAEHSRCTAGANFGCGFGCGCVRVCTDFLRHLDAGVSVAVQDSHFLQPWLFGEQSIVKGNSLVLLL